MAQRPLPISSELPEELEPTDDDDLDDEERTRLHEALREGYEQARRGETISDSTPPLRMARESDAPRAPSTLCFVVGVIAGRVGARCPSSS